MSGIEFVFENPTRILFGPDGERQIGKILSEFGVKKPLLLFGRDSVKRSGLYDIISEALENESIAFVPFGGVQSNPVLSHTRSAIEVAKKECVDAILAVGGGSVIDEGKFVAAGSLVEDDVWDIISFVVPVRKALPIFSILTIAATGSEMNGGAVVTNDETHQKRGRIDKLFFPRVSILNPKWTCTVPANYTAYSTVDALSHVLETYLTRTSWLEMADRMGEAIMKNIVDIGRKLVKNPENVDLRGDFMWSATMALNGYPKLGAMGAMICNHLLEHPLSGFFNIPHGAGLSIVIPAFMKFCVKHERYMNRIELFSRKVMGVRTCEEGIVAFESWCRELGSPTRLVEMKIKREDLEAAILDSHENFLQVHPTNPMTIEEIREVMELAFE